MPRITDDSDPRQPLIQSVVSSSSGRPESGYSTIVDVPSDDSDNTVMSADCHHDFHHGIGHRHYSDRTPWLRAAVLGANDGLVSVAALMLGKFFLGVAVNGVSGCLWELAYEVVLGSLESADYCGLVTLVAEKENFLDMRL